MSFDPPIDPILSLLLLYTAAAAAAAASTPRAVPAAVQRTQSVVVHLCSAKAERLLLLRLPFTQLGLLRPPFAPYQLLCSLPFASPTIESEHEGRQYPLLWLCAVPWSMHDAKG
jgi:hypothetical protein